ncbi:hypothetical protein Pst134EA_024370 [Puccinia striiformis f. sp. tritici]|uniref:hypothetical protein n=1 Tax=Puccinia striiformis f. sp. tritici TaxID=168172 RepID=UPI002008CE85|nr:hypothetical protein Pst134EA_024370 [Puccinia striiformis f. sp. tritici]KAH9453503.1 hypothetical protein Pst134EA_024370 [Puccinia striiformis f. sp. tritici]KAI9614530.1 hypothetical protein KEM48_005996 [Puccinia striiformis f. sp. tritici PST-130]
MTIAESTLLKRQKDWEQGDLIVQRFKNLSSKIATEREKRPCTSSALEGLPVDQDSLKRDAYNQLHLRLLPTLGHQIEDLLRLLKPSNLYRGPRSKLNLVLELQLSIDTTLDEILSLFHMIFPEDVSARADRASDQHFKELKHFRLSNLDSWKMRPLFKKLIKLFEDSYDLIQRLWLSSERPKLRSTRRTPTTIESLLIRARGCDESIELAIQWLKGSEFDIIKDDWIWGIEDINKTMNKLLALIDSTIHLDEDDDDNEVGNDDTDDEDDDDGDITDDNDSDDNGDGQTTSNSLSGQAQPRGQPNLSADHEQPGSEALRDQRQPISDQSKLPIDVSGEPVVQLAKLSIPIVKLSRLFFNKLSNGGMNQNQLPKFTEMTSNQLALVNRSVGDVGDDLEGILKLLNRIEHSHQLGYSYQGIMRAINRLKTRFNSFLSLIYIHFLAHLPDTDHFGDRKYFKKWFDTWETQFSIAIHNLNKLSEALQQSTRL